jgi:hypothetical protein
MEPCNSDKEGVESMPGCHSTSGTKAIVARVTSGSVDVSDIQTIHRAWREWFMKSNSQSSNSSSTSSSMSILNPAPFDSCSLRGAVDPVDGCEDRAILLMAKIIVNADEIN